MKVQRPGSTSGPSKTTKSGKSASSSQTDGSFDAFISSGAETPEAATAQTTQSIAQLDSLLAIQGAENPTERSAKKRLRQRANNILGELDKLRMAMLGGTLTVGHMIDIADVVSAHREKIADPSLTAIMDEIDLRAQVELAKIRCAMDERSTL